MTVVVVVLQYPLCSMLVVYGVDLVQVTYERASGKKCQIPRWDRWDQRRASASCSSVKHHKIVYPVKLLIAALFSRSNWQHIHEYKTPPPLG